MKKPTLIWVMNFKKVVKKFLRGKKQQVFLGLNMEKIVEN